MGKDSGTFRVFILTVLVTIRRIIVHFSVNFNLIRVQRYGKDLKKQ